MDVLETWYSRLDETDYLAMLPKHQKAVLQQADRQGDGAQQLGTGVPEARRDPTASKPASAIPLPPYFMRRGRMAPNIWTCAGTYSRSTGTR